MARKGFTFPELVISMVILLILGSAWVVNSGDLLDVGKNRTAGINAAAITMSISQYAVEVNEYPEKLSDLTKKNGQYGPWLDETRLKDPWDMDYIYAIDETNGRIAVWSCGNDMTNNSGSGVPTNFQGDDVGSIITFPILK